MKDEEVKAKKIISLKKSIKTIECTTFMKSMTTPHKDLLALS
jgi:hypothetical protein